MHIHILGIAGTFMSSLAILAKQLNFKVSGQDYKIYPPMSEQLLAAEIEVVLGYEVADLPDADLFIIGNVMRRGMPIIEHILNQNSNIMSGPDFLSKFILRNRHPLVVTGTHGKTTTTSMLAWILHYAGLDPGYLIGGMPKNFQFSANLGTSKFFVIEGDEYDCAFFDKRSKFMHYRPQTLIINNIEFDHADLFNDLQAIIKQFHYLLRLVPGNGWVIFNEQDPNIKALLDLGVWSQTLSFSMADNNSSAGNSYKLDLLHRLKQILPLAGKHNLSNALAACLASGVIGIDLELAIEAMQEFKGVARRMEYKGCYKGIDIYDDFAHHPTAIKVTLEALIEKNKTARLDNKRSNIVAIVDLGSNTLKMGINNQDLIAALVQANKLYLYGDLNKITWDLNELFNKINKPGKVVHNIEDLVTILPQELQAGDQVLFMSNGSLATASKQLISLLNNS